MDSAPESATSWPKGYDFSSPTPGMTKLFNWCPLGSYHAEPNDLSCDICHEIQYFAKERDALYNSAVRNSELCGRTTLVDINNYTIKMKNEMIKLRNSLNIARHVAANHPHHKVRVLIVALTLDLATKSFRSFCPELISSMRLGTIPGPQEELPLTTRGLATVSIVKILRKMGTEQATTLEPPQKETKSDMPSNSTGTEDLDVQVDQKSTQPGVRTVQHIIKAIRDDIKSMKDDISTILERSEDTTDTWDQVDDLEATWDPETWPASDTDN